MAPSYFASTENPSARIYFQRLRDEVKDRQRYRQAARGS
jgi:hypothetical protein